VSWSRMMRALSLRPLVGGGEADSLTKRGVTAYDRPSPPPARNNANGRRLWWNASGRTLANALANIEGGNSPVPGMPPQRRLSSRADTVVPRRRGVLFLPLGP
jgi:hypothetical protein